MRGTVDLLLGGKLLCVRRSRKQQSILSHFQFAKHFYVNMIYHEHFHESIWRRLEKHLSSNNNPLRKRSGGPKIG